MNDDNELVFNMFMYEAIAYHMVSIGLMSHDSANILAESFSTGDVIGDGVGDTISKLTSYVLTVPQDVISKVVLSYKDIAICEQLAKIPELIDGINNPTGDMILCANLGAEYCPPRMEMV